MTSQPTHESMLHNCRGGKIHVIDCKDCGEPSDLENYFLCSSSDGETGAIGWVRIKDYTGGGCLVAGNEFKS